MNKLLKKVLYNVTRPYAKKYLTANLVKVIEDDEKITCYVKRSKIKKIRIWQTTRYVRRK